MKKTILLSIHFLGRILSWRWLALISGVALIAACGGKAENKQVVTDSVRENTVERTCYQAVIRDKSTIMPPDDQKQENVDVADTVHSVSSSK